MTNNHQFTADFYAKLPHKPYCSDDLGYGVIIRSKKTAIQMPYIQHNPPCLVTSLVFDVDRADAFFAWADANLPEPTWISRNPENYHAHIGYMLASPVCTTHNARQKVIEYLAKIQQAYTLALGADQGYVGLITKNPCHDAWETHISNKKPYELGYLADFVELKELKTDLKEVTGFGRNCAMFDTVRKWAYKAIREYRGSTFDTWSAKVLEHCISVNSAFLNPLPYSEVRATAKSIARYCWKKDAYCYQEFIDRQSRKGRLGGLKSNSSNGGITRAKKYEEQKRIALELKKKGLNNTEISLAVNVSRRTVINWFKGD
ncbi:plasmid replicase [Acinetobacter sp. ACNIH3]|uniref:replication initiation protein n=2 Tax=Moraxellaceae TaxID=468 RepID=UPI000B441928|nr:MULTISPECIES: replication initiation protein [Acinetobacter]MCU4310396.1 replication initiation protein [Acinetobacter radioresistens]OTN22817.1 plasmid replicase [Acinetobacter baumannii]POU13747.1 plasmid replicase [Acinetobacter sp. ACNIH3]POV71336.1 plasmid replicase [Acinetobacter sp. ABNIH27]POV73044.1 plasmid replicase [Acinetobacter sp. ACNIH4]